MSRPELKIPYWAIIVGFIGALAAIFAVRYYLSGRK